MTIDRDARNVLYSHALWVSGSGYSLGCTGCDWHRDITGTDDHTQRLEHADHQVEQLHRVNALRDDDEDDAGVAPDADSDRHDITAWKAERDVA